MVTKDILHNFTVFIYPLARMLHCTATESKISKLNDIIFKLCLSTKFPQQEIKWNFGILSTPVFNSIRDNVLTSEKHRNK